MRAIKSAAILIGAIVPVVYCSYLFYYFFDVGGSVQGVKDIGLGPTVLGLGIVGLIFIIVLVFKVMRLFGGPRTPGSGRYDAPDDDKNPIDVDAAIARYKAERAAEASVSRPAKPSGFTNGPAKPRGFGRRTS